MTKPNTTLIPDSELTQDELEEITGGAFAPTLSLSSSFSPTRYQRFELPSFSLAGDGCGTDDSGAMGCPG